MKKRSVTALISVGVACILVCATYVHNKKDMLNTSEKCEGVADTESPQEEQCKPEGQENDIVTEEIPNGL